MIFATACGLSLSPHPASFPIFPPFLPHHRLFGCLLPCQAMLKDYLLKKDRGQLKCTQAEQRFAHALQPANLAPRQDDGYVHFGDLVMLFNQATDGCVACDPQETLSDETFATTATWYTEPCSRNTFEIQKWTGRGDKKDAMFDYQDDIVSPGLLLSFFSLPCLPASCFYPK